MTNTTARSYGQGPEGSADVQAYLAAAAGIEGTPSVVVTYSSKYGLPSLSGALAGDPAASMPPGSPATRRWMAELDERLQAEGPRAEIVMKYVFDTLQVPSTPIGREPSRPGEIGIVVAEATTTAGVQEALLIEAAIRSSRFVLFHIDNGIDSHLRKAASPSAVRDVAPDALDLHAIEKALHRARVEALIGSAAEALDMGHLAAFEAEDELRVISDWRPADELPAVPETVKLDHSIYIPPAPGPSVPSIPLEQLLQATWRHRRRLSGKVVVDGQQLLCLTVPFGVEVRTDRPAGIVTYALPYEDGANIGQYEVTFTAHLATWLARITTERRQAETIANLAQQLALLAKAERIPVSTSPAETDHTDRCDPRLRRRTDVQLLLENLPQMFDELRSLCSAKSSTFRLLTGDGSDLEGEGEGDDRFLRRVYSDGHDEWSRSPWALRMEAWRTSVNAWVARHGRPVYLREIPAESGIISPETCPDIARYDGLDTVAMYRSNIRSELCVPVFAEDRLVGTMNLESERVGAFDEVALSVEEYAQVIGVSLLEARRRIAANIMETAGGFLDRRHEIEGRLAALQEKITACRIDLPDDVRQGVIDELEELQLEVTVRPPDREQVRPRTVGEIIASAQRTAGSAYASASRELLRTPDDRTLALLDVTLDAETARSLDFALQQAFTNVRVHNTAQPTAEMRQRLGWKAFIALHLFSIQVGGQPNVVVRLDTLIKEAHARRLPVDVLFREPMPDADTSRVRLGTYLAGEVMRRCGGSACARIAPTRSDRCAVLQVEFAAPIDPHSTGG